MSKKEQEIFLSRINFLDNFFNDLFNKKEQEQLRKSRSLFYKESLSELQSMADDISPLSVSGDSGDKKGEGIKGKHKLAKRKKKQSKKKAAKKKQSKRNKAKRNKAKKKQSKKK